MKEIKTNVMRILDKAKIAYEPMYYEIAKDDFDGLKVTDLLGLKYEECFKTLALLYKNELIIAVIPVDKELDLKKCAKALNVKGLEMVHVKDLKKKVGYERGSVSPVGINARHRLIFDSSAKLLSKIEISGGMMGIGLLVDQAALLEFLKAEVADICRS